MKKILLIILPLLLVNVVNAGYQDSFSSYHKLNDVIKYFLGDDDFEITPLDYSRELKFEDNVTILTLNIRYNNINNTGLVVYDTLPKDLVKNAKDDIITINAEYIVVEDDPVIAYYIKDFNQDIKLEYLLAKTESENIKFTMSPIFILGYKNKYNLGDSFVKNYDYRLLVYIFMFIGLIGVIRLVLEMKRAREE